MRKILLPVIFVFLMLCAVNVNAQNIVEMSGESTLEAESFTWAYNAKSNNDSASGGSYIYWDAGIGAAEQKITVVAERDGFYNFDVIAGANGVDNTHSSITFEINGKEKTLKASDIDSSGHSFSGYSGLSVKTFNVFDNVKQSEIMQIIFERTTD